MTHNDIAGSGGPDFPGLGRVISMPSLYSDGRASGVLEYALLASFMGAVVAVGVRLFGTGLSNFFSSVGTAIAAFAT